MNPHELLANWSAWWWPLLAAHLWQSTLFLAATAVAVLMLRNASAAARHRAWLIGSLKFALPALLLATPLGWLGINRPSLGPYVSPAPVIEKWVGSQSSAVGSQPSAVSRQSSPSHSEVYCLLSLAWFSGLMFLAQRFLRSDPAVASLRAAEVAPKSVRGQPLRQLAGKQVRYSQEVRWLTPNGFRGHLSCAERGNARALRKKRCACCSVGFCANPSVLLSFIYQHTQGESRGKENNGSCTSSQITKNTPFHDQSFLALIDSFFGQKVSMG